MVHLIGLGAVGSLLTHYISPKVILNNRQVPCLIFSSIKGKSPLNLRLDTGQDEIKDLIVTTKANHTIEALKPLIPRLSTNSTIYLFQNGGLSVRDELIESGLFPCPISLVSNSHGVTRDNNNIIHTGLGSIFIGECGNLPKLLSRIQCLDVNVVSEGTLNKQLYLKLIVNSVLNSLTGLYQVKNGIIVETLSFYPIIQDLVKECWPAVQMHLEDMSPIQVVDLILSIASKTAKNNNSMQLDIALGKESEIDYILGYLIQTAHRQKLSLPKFQLLYQLVKSKAELIKRFKKPV